VRSLAQDSAGHTNTVRAAVAWTLSSCLKHLQYEAQEICGLFHPTIRAPHISEAAIAVAEWVKATHTSHIHNT
jgi:hypothetical protein